MTPTIRPATPGDAPACAALYAPYVTGTSATSEVEPPDAGEMGRRIAAAQTAHAWLVAEEDGTLVGYAYATSHRARAAYRWTCEVSVYVAGDRHGLGVGRALHEALLARLTDRGFRTAVAVTTLPNPASLALHRSLGFRDAGVLHGVGWKAGRWYDVALLERPLGAGPSPDAPAETV